VGEGVVPDRRGLNISSIYGSSVFGLQFLCPVKALYHLSMIINGYKWGYHSVNDVLSLTLKTGIFFRVA